MYPKIVRFFFVFYYLFYVVRLLFEMVGVFVCLCLYECEFFARICLLFHFDAAIATHIFVLVAPMEIERI